MSFIHFLLEKRKTRNKEKEASKMKKFPLKMKKSLKKIQKGVVNKSAWHGCILVYSFPIVNLIRVCPYFDF